MEETNSLRTAFECGLGIKHKLSPQYKGTEEPAVFSSTFFCISIRELSYSWTKVRDLILKVNDYGLIFQLSFLFEDSSLVYFSIIT